MAKPKRSAADLDAELAELEAKLASLGQRKPRAAPPVPAAPKALDASEPAPAAPAPAPRFDLSLWRQEEGAWVRSVPHEAIVVRRVLDEEGNVVREEAASPRDLDEETPARAERGIAKLFRRRSR